MATYISPVTVPALQEYLKDSSVDATLIAFYQTLLDAATEYVYHWLDRDFTPSATKTDRFFGDDSQYYAPHDQVGSLTSWTMTDRDGVATSNGVGDLFLRMNGYLVQIKSTSTKTFACGYEHWLTYQLPSSLTCPETVMQVITEIAALLFRESNQGEGLLAVEMSSARDGSLGFTGGFSDRERYIDLSEKHKEMLRPYKRYPV